jgi:WD40 repeat protein/serine/threonine protein kinase
MSDTPKSTQETIFADALAQPPGEREAFVDRACADDCALAAHVKELLRGYEENSGFLETPPGGAEGVVAGVGDPGTGLAEAGYNNTAREPVPGDHIGHYKLLERIGEGACGIVYMAEQEQPVRRRVALKLIKLGLDTGDFIARFEAERQALALMDHPHIARVFDAGATDTGRPFFVMELVRGIPITRYCDETKLPPAARLELFIQVCHAIQHAHQKGIIHRDIKPSNILVAVNDGEAVPKVIDFGIAKATQGRLTDKTLFTRFHAFIGTPAYSSPEQAEVTNLDVDTRSDIYSLGVLLYELLTGHQPMDHAAIEELGFEEVRRIIREVEPPRPSARVSSLGLEERTSVAQRRAVDTGKLALLLRSDLDWIVMRCLEKDRRRRYETASALAQDVRRHLDNEPVTARPPSTAYRMRKFIRRHKPAFVAVSGIAAALVAGLVVSAVLLVRERAARARAVEAEQGIRAERERAEDNLYAADMNLVQQALAQSSRGQARALLERHRPVPGEVDRRGFEWRYLWALSESDEREILRVNEGQRSQRIIVAIPGTTLIAADDTVWDTNSPARPVFTLPSGSIAKAFDAMGGSLLAGGWHGLVSWSTAIWEPREMLAGERVHVVVVSADGRWMATGGEQLRLWARDESSWRQVASRPLAFRNWHNEQTLAFSPDGTSLVSGTGETWANRCTLEFWSVPALEPQPGLPGAPGDILSLAFSPDGSRLVTGCWNGRIRVWNLDSREEIDSTMGHHGFVTELAFSPADPDVFATAASDRTVRLWNLRTGAELVTLQGPLNQLWALTFTDAGDTLLTLEQGGRIAAWDTAMRRRQGALIARGPCTMPLGFSADGGTLVTMDEAGTLRWWDVARRCELEAMRRTLDLTGVSFRDFATIAPVITRDLATLAIGMIDGRVQLWHLPTRTAHTWNAHAQIMRNLAFSPDGETLATVADDAIFKLWNVASRALLAETGISGQLVWEDNHVPLVWSADGRTIALSTLSAIMLHDGAGGRLLRTLDPGGLVYSMRFSPDDSVLVSAADDFQLAFWDPRSGALVDRIATSHQEPVFDICFSPDGRTLATVVDQVKLWSLATRQEVSTLRGHEHNIFAALFSPDGNLLVTADYEGAVRLWSAPPFAAIDGENTR